MDPISTCNAKEIDNRRKVVNSVSFTNKPSQGQPQHCIQSGKPNKVTQDSHGQNIENHGKWQQIIVHATYKQFKGKQHHFRNYVRSQTQIFKTKIDNKSQLTDYLTKAVKTDIMQIFKIEMGR